MYPPEIYSPGQVARWIALQTCAVLAMVIPFTVVAICYFFDWDLHNTRDGYAVSKFILELALLETLLFCPVMMIPVFWRLGMLKSAREALDKLANTDPLTGLLNRRGFDAVAAENMTSRAWTGRPLAVLVCDIDFFKRVNDTHGHEFGDVVLRRIGEAMREVAGEAPAVLARRGGEEFAALLPGADHGEAHAFAERLRTFFENSAITSNGVSASITVSIGLAASGSYEGEMARLLESADAALYAAKRAGRNRVEAGHNVFRAVA